MKILVSGSTGFIGSTLLPHLSAKGHQSLGLSRQASHKTTSLIHWDPPRRGPDPVALDGVEAVVHLAGESIASGRWTDAQKTKIRDSRVQGTRLLVDSLLQMKEPPHTFISASAIGYYGDRAEEILTESSRAGDGFLPEVCQAWEAASAPVAAKGIRLIHLRFGIILSPRGGALQRMLIPFRLGVGGKIGSGKQWMSWVALDDVIGAITFALENKSVHGPVNVTSPQNVTNAEFTKTLGRVLHRPTLFPLPAVAARIALGEMADALLLSSARVQPSALLNASYPYQWAGLETALQHLLGK